MASEIKLPELGENVEGGTVVSLSVAVGDDVSEGQDLLEVEAGKSTVPVPSPMSGRVSDIKIQEGDEVKTGQLLFLIDSSNGAPSAKKEAPPKKAEKPSQEQPSEEQPAEEDSEEKEQESTTETEKESPALRPFRPAAQTQPKPETKPAPRTSDAKLVPASPATRMLARELGVDLSHVTGTARNGRVTQEDIKAYVRQRNAGSGSGQRLDMDLPPLPDFQKWGEIENQPLDNIRRTTAKQMALAWSLIPHVTQHDLADITELEAFRKAQNQNSKARLTVTAFAMKAAAIALGEFPEFNSSLDLGRDQLIIKKYFHIGVAVDTDHGLLVPVFRDVDKKSVHELAKELGDVAQKARDRKISLNDLQGGTFTITNLGGIGGTSFTPIVNYPEVAILGMSRGRQQPVIKEGQVIPRLMLPLSLSYDHRVIDGANAARFTRRIVEMLENPLMMLLHA